MFGETCVWPNSELDNIFKGKFEKIKISENKDSDNSNSKILPKNIKDEDMYLTTKSSRHNQIISLLTEIDETNLDDGTSSIKSSRVTDNPDAVKKDDLSKNNDSPNFQDETSLFTETINIPSDPDFSDISSSSSSSSSDIFSDTSESS